MVDEAGIQLRYEALDPVLDERSRRRFAAAEAWAAGRGGVAVVSRITGVARSTINRGLAELRDDTSRDVVTRRVRRPGGGRKRLTDIDATLLSDLGVTARFVQNCTLRVCFESVHQRPSRRRSRIAEAA